MKVDFRNTDDLNPCSLHLGRIIYNLVISLLWTV